MREIKFRAWQDDKMVFSPLSSNYGLTRFFGFLYEDAPIMQYTGLKDKNGKEIYEGDILKYYDMLFPIIFDYGCFYGDGESDNLEFDSCDYNKLEVIGNIHENPELLEVK